jgi:DNA-binding transcriptional MocR family regulator
MPRSHSNTVVKRIAEELRSQIESRLLRAGTHLPSVRQLARDRKISAFTAAEIYNTLVATGTLEARPGLGYFVPSSPEKTRDKPRLPEFPADALWERRRESGGQQIKVDAGCGWLPADWLYTDGVRRALRTVARSNDVGIGGYGNPYGFSKLRQHLASQMQLRGIEASEDQIVLTQGASQALDLVVRHSLASGDTAIAEDPGYPPFFELLRARGVKLLGLPRTQSGPDTEKLAQLLKRRRTKLLFTNTTFQNPTGTTTRPAVAHRLLELANQHDFTIVEDDIFAEFAPRPEPTLASLDNLHRVIYISSVSKTISPDLRVGYVVAPQATAQKLAQIKVMTSLASSELMEQVVLQILTDGHYRRHLEKLRRRLADAQVKVSQALESNRVDLAFKPQSGMFLWGKLPSKEPVGKLWRMALNAGILLAPGELFRPDGKATPYWRFNVAHCDEARLYKFLSAL